MTARWTVWSAGKDGNRHDEAHANDPALALRFAQHLRSKSPRLKLGITDNDDPEAGDVTDRMEPAGRVYACGCSDLGPLCRQHAPRPRGRTPKVAQ